MIQAAKKTFRFSNLYQSTDRLSYKQTSINGKGIITEPPVSKDFRIIQTAMSTSLLMKKLVRHIFVFDGACYENIALHKRSKCFLWRH